MFVGGIGIVAEFVVLDNHERLRRLQVFLAGGGHLQQSVVIDVLLQVARDERLTDDGTPYLVVHALAGTEQVVVLVLVGDDLLGLAADDEVHDVVGAEVLLDGLDDLQRQHQLVLGLNLGLRVQTVVAVMAVLLLVVLAEVVQQHLTATNGGLGVGGRLLQQLATDVLLGHGLALHELVELAQVLIAVEGQADALPTVATGTAGLLVVALQRLGDVVVDDEAHVGLVDAHAEGDGGHDDVDVLHQELVLGLSTGVRVETGVVGQGLDLVGTQDLGQLLHLFPRQTVDDAALIGVLLDELDDVLVNVLRLRAHLVVQVRTVKRRLELRGVHDA